jgi:hypothetical protein
LQVDDVADDGGGELAWGARVWMRAGRVTR